MSEITSVNLRPNGSVGRFELRKMLGQGAQSTVWLAFDPRMEREVAIKVMRLGEGSDDKAVAQWLAEARSVSRVTHPNIVPVYEADIQDRQPYLVFEYIQGLTLSQVLKQRGALPAPEAVALMCDVLDAVSVAHKAGVVHRDLKPSNILVDASGRARVMDFGIAARIQTTAQADAQAKGGGTVGYMSPEAANGEEASLSMDIFSAGVVLAELLMGKPLIQETDTFRSMYRVIHEQMVLPAQLDAGVDDRLRAIVNRALVRDPQQRFPSAGDFLLALEQWAKPAPVAPDGAPASAASQGGTLEFLLRRMRHKSDFPAMSDSVVRIQRFASSDTESVNSVTNEILKDVALTNKLLRLVNTAHYARGGNISTVSRAVQLVGFNGIRNMALSLVLLEHMQDKAHAALLKEEFLRSLMAGTIGGHMCQVLRESEEASIGAMFQNLGRLLVQFYFQEEASQVRSLMQSPREPMTETTAAMHVLGLTYEQLGLGVAKAWGLPQDIQRCMRKPVGTPPGTTPADAGERIRWIALASNEIADVLLHADPKVVDARIAEVSQKYARSVGRSAKEMQAATRDARLMFVDLTKAMDIHVAPGSAAAKLLKGPSAAPEPEESAELDAGANIRAYALHATQTQIPKAAQSPRARMVADTLSAGIQDITNAMVEEFKLTDVLRMILETMYRALAFDRVIFCMRDAKTEMMTGRFGLGDGVEQHVKSFKTHLKAPTPDLFSMVCNKGSDTLIGDATEARMAQRLPQWYRASINAPTFLLLPLQIKGAPFGLIYADKVALGTLELDEKELALLRTLRNQAVMAFKQSS